MTVETIPTYDSVITADEIDMTGIATEQMAKLFAEVDDDEIEAIRIYVAGGGCGGMTYGMTFTDRKTQYDKVLDGDGFRLYVDAVALNYLQGVEVDYVSRETGASFVFNNVFQSTGGSGLCGSCGAAVGPGGGCA